MIDSIEKAVTGNDMAVNIFFAVLFWALILPLLRHFYEATFMALFHRPIPVSSAYIPARVPHPNPAGSAVLFEIPVVKASNEQLSQFMHFRGYKNWKLETDGLDMVVANAAAYKGELYEERTMTWIDEHFRLRKPNLSYPYVAPHWNGWSSFWAETAPHIRNMCVSSFILTFEHVLNGLFLPALYLFKGCAVYFELAMYGEIGYQVVSCACISVSYAIGRDVTVEQMHRAVWPLLLVHHACTVGLCVLCIQLGDSCPRDLACYFMFSLLGLTSTLHYIGQMFDFTPFSQPSAPYIRLSTHLFTLASMIWFRCIYWFKIAYLVVEQTANSCGTKTTVGVALVMLLFTAFNVDFVKFHIKATFGCWKKMNGAKKL